MTESWLDFPSQSFECSRFTSSINSQKTKALAIFDLKAEIIYCYRLFPCLITQTVLLEHFPKILNLDCDILTYLRFIIWAVTFPAFYVVQDDRPENSVKN